MVRRERDSAEESGEFSPSITMGWLAYMTCVLLIKSYAMGSDAVCCRERSTVLCVGLLLLIIYR